MCPWDGGGGRRRINLIQTSTLGSTKIEALIAIPRATECFYLKKHPSD